MTTKGQLLAEIRSDIQDTGATPKYTDATLYLYAKDAIRDYSTYFPKRIDRSELTQNGQAYDLPTDFLQDVSVECPLDRFMERRQDRPGSRRFLTLSKANSVYHRGRSLKLNGSPLDGETVYLTYDAVHPVPVFSPKRTWTLRSAERDLELIRLYVKAKSNEQLRTKQANLDRFKLGSGPRATGQSNPTPEVADLMEDYRTKIGERISGPVSFSCGDPGDTMSIHDAFMTGMRAEPQTY